MLHFLSCCLLPADPLIWHRDDHQGNEAGRAIPDETRIGRITENLKALITNYV